MLLLLPLSLISLLQGLLSVQYALGSDISAASVTSPVNTRPQASSTTGRIRTKPVTVYKPRSLEYLKRTRLRSLQRRECEANLNQNGTERGMEWNAVQVDGPDVEDRHTLAQLARMSGNAYALPGHSNWYDVDSAWNTSFPFGWEEGEGFRGHVFLSADNNTVVLSIKGTTLNGPTSRLDKYNDNLLFSCCCARHAWVLRTVCDCYGSGWTCSNQCLSETLIQDSLFYSIGTKLIDDLVHIYPNANIWLVGHSLGGALASLLGATYGLPAVAFESPGEKLAAQRLHLPLPPMDDTDTDRDSGDVGLLSGILQSALARIPILSYALASPPHVPRSPPPPPPLAASITHVYHTADPIPFGTCSGLYSTCASGGYALETKCHLGKTIVFDTVNRMKWLVDVRKHVIKEIVKLLDVPKEGEDGVDWGDDADDGGDDDGGDDDEPCKDPNWCFDGKEVSMVEGVVRNVWRGVFGMRGAGPMFESFGLPGRKKKGGKGKHGDEDGDQKEPPNYNRVPKAVVEADCVDCFRWEFVDGEVVKDP